MQLTALIGAVFVLLGSTILPSQTHSQTATLEFRVRVIGTVCAQTTYWAVVGPPHEQFYHQLRDTDGDTIFTLHAPDAVGAERAIRLVQGSGTRQSAFGPEPNQPITLIKDFGIVTITGPLVFEAGAAGCPAALPDTGERSRAVSLLIIAGALLASGVFIQRRRRWQAS